MFSSFRRTTSNLAKSVPKTFSSFSPSTMNKSILGGSLLALPGLITVAYAITAYFGIGEMPIEEDLQKAIVDLALALGGGILIYLVPNWKSQEEEVKIEKEEAPVVRQKSRVVLIDE